MWVVVLAIANAYLTSRPFMKIGFFKKLAVLMTILAPLVYFMLLAHALFKLRGFKDHF
jgi:hypothetical protein